MRGKLAEVRPARATSVLEWGSIAIGSGIRLPRSTRPLVWLGIVAAAALLSGCAPIESPGKTGQIELVSTSASGGWTFELYRNKAYPCSISGYQTFVLGTKDGSSATAERPLWVRMRGGGVGYFDSTGQPQPSAGNKSEENAAGLTSVLPNSALTGLVRNDPAGFRLVSVSMCNHDIYAGGEQPDPNNPNRLPDGGLRTVNGLFATKAAIQFAGAKYPTSKTFLHGTSAGSFGTFHVAWSLERQGIPPAGVVSDSGVLNSAWEQARVAQNLCNDDRSQEALEAIRARIHPDVTKSENEPAALVRRAGLTVPVMHVYSRADNNSCGATPMTCPLPDGTTATLGATDCRAEPLRQAIAAQGAGSRSRNLRLCVSPEGAPGSCSVHVVTNKTVPNTDPAEPANYNGAIMDWVRARLADPGP